MEHDSSSYLCKAMLSFAKKSWKGAGIIYNTQNKVNLSKIAQLEYLLGLLAEHFMSSLNFHPFHILKPAEKDAYPLFEFSIDMRFIGPSLAKILMKKHLRVGTSSEKEHYYVYSVNLLLTFICLDVDEIKDFQKQLVKYFSAGANGVGYPDFLVSRTTLILDDIDVSTTVNVAKGLD